MSGDADADAVLVDRILAGDDSALAALYDQFGSVVYGIASRMVGATHAGDICQEVFATVWDHPERFDPAKGSLRAFLVTIGRRRCIDHLRRHDRRAAHELRAERERPIAAPSVDEMAFATVTANRLRGALTHLPPPQREAIELAYFDGLSFRQVADATGVSEGTAKSRIRLGLRRLAGQMREHEEVESP